MGHIINFPNVSISVASIASFELNTTEARIEVVLNSGKEYTFSYASDQDAKAAYNSIKGSFSLAGFDSTFINF